MLSVEYFAQISGCIRENDKYKESYNKRGKFLKEYSLRKVLI
jgi:hypothetical protein